MDEPCSALDPVATLKVEELMQELKESYTIVIVTHNMQQAARTSDRTGFFLLGNFWRMARREISSPDPRTANRKLCHRKIWIRKEAPRPKNQISNKLQYPKSQIPTRPFWNWRLGFFLLLYFSQGPWAASDQERNDSGGLHFGRALRGIAGRGVHVESSGKPYLCPGWGSTAGVEAAITGAQTSECLRVT